MNKISIFFVAAIALAEVLVGSKKDLPKSLKDVVQGADQTERASDNGTNDPVKEIKK